MRARVTAGSADRRVGIGLDGLNFFLADVRDGLGPYLAIYLLTVGHWDAQSIGIVMTAMGVASLVAQAPVGALVDTTRRKRALIVAAALVIPVAAVGITFTAAFWPIVAVKVAMGVAAAVFGPAIVAITLGTVGRARFTARIGRNETFNHAGNAVAALLAGAVAWAFGIRALFYMVGGFGLASIASVLTIPAGAIDHRRARGLAQDQGEGAPSGLKVLVECRPLLVFALCALLFHLANAAMLPLVGQKLALEDQPEAALFMSACIIGAQIVMVPMAMLAGAKADRWGRKALFLAGFAILPLRGVLYTLSDAPTWLLAVQLLDGVGAGLFGALAPLIIDDLTEGTGRFNVSQGAVATVQGIGAALSTTLAGVVVVHWGYSDAFLTLAAIAATGCVVFLVAMPETGASALRRRFAPLRARR